MYAASRAGVVGVTADTEVTQAGWTAGPRVRSRLVTLQIQEADVAGLASCLVNSAAASTDRAIDPLLLMC